MMKNDINQNLILKPNFTIVTNSQRQKKIDDNGHSKHVVTIDGIKILNESERERGLLEYL